MSLSYLGFGANNVGTTTNGVYYPASISAGDLLIIVASVKPETVTYNDISGWTKVTPNGTVTGGTGSQANDTGPTRIQLYYRIADGSETGQASITYTGTANIGITFMHQFRSTSGTYAINAANGHKDSGGASWSVTAGQSLAVAAGDVVLTGISTPDNDETSGWSSDSLTGCGTFSTIGAGTSGGPAADGEAWFNTVSAMKKALRCRAFSCSVGGSGAPVHTVTINGTTTNSAGPEIFVQIAEPITNKSSGDTVSQTDAPVSIALSGADTATQTETWPSRAATAPDTAAQTDAVTARSLTADDTSTHTETEVGGPVPIDKSDGDTAIGQESSATVDQPGEATNTSQVWAGSQTNDGQSWTSPTACQGAPNAAGAVSGVANGGTTWIQPAGYGTFGSIPAGSTINSITVQLYTWENNVSRWDTETAQLYVNGSPVGSTSALSESTSTSHNDSEVFSGTIPSLSDLQSGNLQVRVSAHRSSSSASTFTVDAVGVVVNYTAPTVSTKFKYDDDDVSAVDEESLATGVAKSDGDTVGQAETTVLVATAPTQNDPMSAAAEAVTARASTAGDTASDVEAGTLAATLATANDAQPAATEAVTARAATAGDTGTQTDATTDRTATAGDVMPAATDAITARASTANDAISATVDAATALAIALLTNDVLPAATEAVTARAETAADTSLQVDVGTLTATAPTQNDAQPTAAEAVTARASTAADTASDTEAGSLATAISSGDTGGTLEQSPTQSADLAGQDTASDVESVTLTVYIASADTAGDVEGEQALIAPEYAFGADTSTVTDAATALFRDSSASDIATATDAVAGRDATAGDTATESEAVTGRSATGTDSASDVEATTDRSATADDTGTQSDAVTARAATAGDTVSETEASSPILISITGADAASVIEAVQAFARPETDTSSIADAVEELLAGGAKSSADTVSILENASVAVTEAAADTAGDVEAATLLATPPTQGDTSSHVEAGTLAATEQSADTATETEAVTGRSETAPDTSTHTEQSDLVTALAANDTAGTLEAVSIEVQLVGSDFSVITDDGSLTINLESYTDDDVIGCIDDITEVLVDLSNAEFAAYVEAAVVEATLTAEDICTMIEAVHVKRAWRTISYGVTSVPHRDQTVMANGHVESDELVTANADSTADAHQDIETVIRVYPEGSGA